MIITGDCLDALRAMPSESVDAVVTDPPYGLGRPPPAADVLRAWLDGETYRATGGGFMGAAWDAFVPGPEVWREVARVLKPGGHAVIFAGSRTLDWMGISVRLGGLEIRDTLGWVYWSGFPKSMDASKAIDAAAGPRADRAPGRDATGRRPVAGRMAIAGKGRGSGGVFDRALVRVGGGSMNVELEALARRAVACPRWRWMSGMLVTGAGWYDWARLCDVDPASGLPDLWEYRGYLRGPCAAGRLANTDQWAGGDWAGEDAYPDLTDPATLGCLLALVREAHGPSAVARHIGTNGRGGQEWAIYDRAPLVDGWHVAAPALGYWESEIKALVAALENGGGGV